MLGVGFWQDYISVSPNYLDFAVCCEGGAQLVFRSFSKGIYSICNCRFSVSVGRGEFRIFLHHHLEPSSNNSFI